MLGPRRDGFTLRYGLLAVVGCLLLEGAADLDRFLDLFSPVPVALVPVLAIVLAIGLGALVNLAARRWRRAVSATVAVPLACAVLSMSPNLLDWLEFQAMRPSYAASLPAPGPTPRLRGWLFRDAGAFGALVVETYVVFDEADELAGPPAAWPDDWRRQVAEAAGADPNFHYLAGIGRGQDRPALDVVRIAGHWYFVSLPF